MKFFTYIMGLLGAIFLASTCCMLPMIMIILGFSGSLISGLQKFNWLEPYAIAGFIIFMIIGIYDLYFKKQSCDVDKPCANSNFQKWQKRAFWGVFIISIFMFGFPYLAPYITPLLYQ